MSGARLVSILLCVVLLALISSGCASQKYGDLYREKGQAYEKYLTLEGKTIDLFGRVLADSKTSPEMRGLIAGALIMRRTQALHLPEPKAGPIERGLGAAIAGAPGWPRAWPASRPGGPCSIPHLIQPGGMSPSTRRSAGQVRAV
jgi:hypothetical protein